MSDKEPDVQARNRKYQQAWAKRQRKAGLRKVCVWVRKKDARLIAIYAKALNDAND